MGCLTGMLVLTFQTVMSLQSAGIGGVTKLCPDLFAMFYLLDDCILGMFRIKEREYRCPRTITHPIIVCR